MRRRATIAEIRQVAYKQRDSWWTVLLVDPVAVRLVQLLSPYRWITPNRITGASFALGLGAAACFAGGSRAWLVAGALLFHLSFVLDCVDGKIARLTGTGSVFGGWLDYILDRFRVLACAIGLFGADQPLLGGAVVFLDMFRYLNAMQLTKAREQLGHAPESEWSAGYGRVRGWLLRHRIRAHLFSGIEFHMAVFIVGPLLGMVTATAIVACGLLVLFEAALIYKLFRITRTVAEANI